MQLCPRPAPWLTCVDSVSPNAAAMGRKKKEDKKSKKAAPAPAPAPAKDDDDEDGSDEEDPLGNQSWTGLT